MAQLASIEYESCSAPPFDYFEQRIVIRMRICIPERLTFPKVNSRRCRVLCAGVPFALACCTSAQSLSPLPVTPLAGDPAIASVQPAEQLGADDLLELTVTNCPELSRNFRIASNGSLSLPLLRAPLVVAGLTPAEVSDRLRLALVHDQILNDPVVNVAVLEYRSRPVSVVGAVNHPLTFQATGHANLLDALARAGGLSPLAGNTVIVTTRSSSGASAVSVQVIDTKQLIAGVSPVANLQLHGGEEIRVPEGEKIFVAGDVVHPGMYPMQNGTDTTVVKAIALSSGLAAYSSGTAYIYRRRPTGAERDEVKVPLKDILSHHSPDVALLADDILYIPTSDGKRITSKVLGQISGFSQSAAGLLVLR